MTGTARIAAAAPDGYQFSLGSVDTMAINQTLYKKPLYNALTDFTPVGLAIEQPILLIARTIQGYGGGLLLSQSMGLVSDLYPPVLRTRVLALVSGVWGVAALVGPLIGGVFGELGWWRGAFWTTVPIIVVRAFPR